MRKREKTFNYYRKLNLYHITLITGERFFLHGFSVPKITEDVQNVYEQYVTNVERMR